jgi:hypothetical protein
MEGLLGTLGRSAGLLDLGLTLLNGERRAFALVLDLCLNGWSFWIQGF